MELGSNPGLTDYKTTSCMLVMKGNKIKAKYAHNALFHVAAVE